VRKKRKEFCANIKVIKHTCGISEQLKTIIVARDLRLKKETLWVSFKKNHHYVAIKVSFMLS
jgi:hypothetical protein